VTLITLRLQREFRLCQVTITSYTRWPFLDRGSAPVRSGQGLQMKAVHSPGIMRQAGEA
jgi:hypothetical protein